MSNNEKNWGYEAVFYQLYPLGFCGAPFENDGVLEHRILKVLDWVDHIEKLGCNAVYFSPVFESDTHGYNTRDYCKIDTRLGTNEDFKQVCDALHAKGIRVVLDGVFNHVGRGFTQFRDVCEKKWDSPYKDWFNINFDGNSNYNDGLWYEGWEGHYDLVKLNLRNPAVVDHLLNAVKYWIEYFGIDGIRLDVAYLLDFDFMKRLRSFTDSLRDDFFLVGEMVHGQYQRWANPEMLHSVTNFECYKGLYSSFNSMNMFEICHSLKNRFGPENWCEFRGLHLLNFVDNHDVTRIASILTEPKHLPLVYTMLFGMPGIPCVYYGSEWGVKGNKSEGDPALRPAIDKPEWNELTDLIARLARAHRESKALQYGDIKVPVLTNRQCVLQRDYDGERVFVAVNADSQPFTAHFDAGFGMADDLANGGEHDFGGGSELAPYSYHIWRCK